MLAWGRRLLSLAMTLALATLLYSTAALGYVLLEAGEFRGICPAGPPDVAPYPCSVFELAERLLFGPFALVGHLALFGGLVVALVSSWITGEVAMGLFEKFSKTDGK